MNLSFSEMAFLFMAASFFASRICYLFYSNMVIRDIRTMLWEIAEHLLCILGLLALLAILVNAFADIVIGASL